MPKRLIVPDASVMVPAYFPETLRYRSNDFDLSRRAKPIVAAISDNAVVAIAPENLICEFTKTAHRKIAEGISPKLADAQVDSFLYLFDRYIREKPVAALVKRAWKLCTENQIPPPDSWYLACAMEHDAELWVSCEIVRDRFVEHAREVYNQVYTLTERPFT